ncbi:phosphatase and actin regulator 2 [Trichonephila clavipes]|nr:phosphatase and actin regulator 2 [Trichonephila clavipes]
MKTSSVEFISRSPNPLPMKSKHHRFVLLRKIFQPWQWKRRKKRNRFKQTSRTLQRKISMRSTKDQLIKKDVLMPVKHNVFLWNLPDVEEVPSHDGETILLWSPWKYRCGQRTVRMAVVACSQKAKHSLRAQAHQSKSRTETVKTETLEKKLLREKKENARGIEVKVGITFHDGDRFNSCQVIYSQFGLAIHQNDHQARRRFVEWAQNEMAVVPDFHKRILFSDEAHFWLNGYVNKQNCRIGTEANPQVYVETPLHPEKLTVWCALWAGGILLQKR